MLLAGLEVAEPGLRHPRLRGDREEGLNPAAGRNQPHWRFGTWKFAEIPIFGNNMYIQ